MAKLILVTEAARRLGVNRQTIENWSAKGVLKIRKIGKAHYVDADVIAGIGDLGQDVEESRKKLEEMKAEYSREKYEIERMQIGLRVERQDLNDERRYLNLCVSGGIRSQFFQSILYLMECYGSLTCRESEILRQRLEGVSFDELGEKYGLKRESIRQIVEKAIRKSRDLTDIKDLFDIIQNYQADNTGLKATIKDLREKLRVQDEIDRLAAEKSLEEKRQQIIENDNLCKLLNTRLVDCDLSVRVLNCLKGGEERYGRVLVKPCETIGDVCRMNKTDFLKIRNAGKKSLTELDDFLETLNLEWGMDVDKIFKERVEHLLFQEEQNDGKATL